MDGMREPANWIKRKENKTTQESPSVSESIWTHPVVERETIKNSLQILHNTNVKVESFAT